MRWPAVALLVGLGACGGGGGGATTEPGPITTPPPADAGRLNMTLAAHLDTAALTGRAGVQGSGNWGYTSRDGRRFALTGTSVGLSIVEVSDPQRPRNIALIEGATSAWREVKTFREYLYVTTEARTGLDIVDMRDPDHPVKVQTWNRTFDSAHSLWIDQRRGLLFANGTRTGLHVLDLRADPRDPVEVGVFDGFYVHDSYSRADTLYAAAIQDGFLALLDISNPANIRPASRFFTGGRLTHNAWLTDDGRYLFTTDERPGLPVEGWDMADPANPQRVSTYIGAPNTIPHNVMIDGNRLLLSHYTEGVHLLDIANPAQPRRLGFLDTQPAALSGFAGCWGAYIFPRTNLIVASDIQGGLFVIMYTGQ